MKINPRTITYVRTVAEERSFSKAAEKLYISQPSLSQHILNAEKEYGVQFFNRRSVPISLTYAGERFLSIADEMERLDEQLYREMEDINGSVTGRITVGVSSTRGARFIPQLFAQFRKRFPGVELILMEDSSIRQLDAVRSGKVDFAFTGYGDDDLADILIAERDIMLAMRRDHPLSTKKDRETIHLTDYVDMPFVLLNKGRGIRRMADQLFSENSINPVVAYETSSYNMALGLAEQGLGATFVIDHEMRLPESMVAYHIAGSKETYQVHLVYRKDLYLSRAFQHFVELSKGIDEHVRSASTFWDDLPSGRETKLCDEIEYGVCSGGKHSPMKQSKPQRNYLLPNESPPSNETHE